MARCKSCSAPLQANTNKCVYCGVRNDIDLHAKQEFSVYKQQTERLCPHCEIPLQTIQLKLKHDLFIERCSECFGLFFDIGEMELLLQSSVSQVQGINLAHIDAINADRYSSKKPVKYILCPVCRQFMRRTNFAKKSGVIVDSCQQHGLWLDSGEITHLMEWKKAGGQLLQAQEEKKSVKSRNRKPSARVDGLWLNSSESGGIKSNDSLLDFLSYIIKQIL